jgi:putative phosphoribosyl transferase
MRGRKTMFRDRADAGRRLAERLLAQRAGWPVVLALPRGGVPVGYEIARALEAPLDVVLVRKIGAPRQPELAVGAIVDGAEPEIVVNHDVVEELAISAHFIEEEAARQQAENARRRQLYRPGRPRLNLHGRTAIVVDDGIATGATIRAALRAVRRGHPKRLVLAAPVAPPETVRALEAECDDLVCLVEPTIFGGISAFYDDFRQLEDAEVIELLKRAEPFAEPGAGKEGEGNDQAFRRRRAEWMDD